MTVDKYVLLFVVFAKDCNDSFRKILFHTNTQFLPMMRKSAQARERRSLQKLGFIQLEKPWHPLGYIQQLGYIQLKNPQKPELLGQCLICRVQRVGVFNFGTDRVRVLEKTSGSGLGMDRVRVLAPLFISIGYYRVLKILIGYFLVTFLIRYFCLVQLRS